MEERIDRCDECCTIMRSKKGEDVHHDTDLIHIGGSSCFHIDGYNPFTTPIINGDYCSTSCAIKAFSKKLVEKYDEYKLQIRNMRAVNG